MMNSFPTRINAPVSRRAIPVGAVAGPKSYEGFERLAGPAIAPAEKEQIHRAPKNGPSVFMPSRAHYEPGHPSL
jgi:hypothetical protein